MPQTSDSDAIRAANAGYYAALSARDMPAMERVWTCASDNILIAPPVKPRTHVGWVAIKRNWESYWPTFAEYSVTMEPTSVSVNGPVAWVHGVETSRRRTTSGETSGSSNFGINIFVHHEGRWLMVFHQSTAMPD
jgi:ketosteroid isomerase-like protein